MNEEMERIKHQMLTQSNRATSYPIFIVVEDKRVYGVASDLADGRERREDYGGELCESCKKLEDENDYIPDDCEDCPDEMFVNYRIEEDVPNLYAGFFFTAEACIAHIESNAHHYNKTAKSYAISAYHNHELRDVMKYICGKDLR